MYVCMYYMYVYIYIYSYIDDLFCLLLLSELKALEQVIR